MAKIIGIDLGTTYSAVSVWDDKKKEAVILENLRGNRTTPSVVSFNKAGELIVGEDAKQNLWAAPEDTVSQIKREMGTDFHVTMRGKEYNPQTISAFILRYLKQCAEAKLGEPVYDAVITCPAYFKEVQRTATRDAGIMAGLNVHQLINEPTSAAIAFGLEKRAEGEKKIYAVYDLGGGTFDVSIIEIGDEITVLGTGGDPRLGGLDMDEAVMKWALRQIKQQNNGLDLSADESVRRRLKVEAEQIKKTLVVSETASLNVPFLTMIDGKPLNIDLSISRAQFEMLIMPLLQRSIDCWEQAVIAAKEANQVDWEDIDGVLVVGGPTRLHKIREMLRDTLKKHNPGKEPEIRTDINPDEVVAMGAAIVAGTLVPFGVPPSAPEAVKDDARETHREEAKAAGTVAPEVVFYDVTGHSLGIAIKGTTFHRLIDKDTPIPVQKAEQGFSNAADYATQLLVEVYQGENDYVAANTKIGEVNIEGIEPLPAGQHSFQIEFRLDLSGTLSTICTDLRTKKQYTGSFVFKDFTRISQEEIQKKQKELEALMPDKFKGNGQPPATATAPTGAPAGAPPQAVPAEAPAAVPQLPPDKIPAEWRVYWMESLEQLGKLEPNKRAVLLRAMNTFARAVMGGNPAQIEDSAYLLQDALLEVKA